MKPIVVGPTNTTVKVGEDARFECKVAPSDLQHHTQWLKHYTVNGSYRDATGQPYVNIIQVHVVHGIMIGNFSVCVVLLQKNALPLQIYQLKKNMG